MQFVMWFEDHYHRSSHILPHEASSSLRKYFARKSAHELNLDANVKVNVVDTAHMLIKQHLPTPLCIFQPAYLTCCSLLEYSSIPAYKAHKKTHKKNQGCSRHPIRSIREVFSKKKVSVIDVRRCL